MKAKDLSYDATQPAFLRRLRGEIAGSGDDRHERPIARPKKAKQDDEDDEPTYVLEETNESLSKKEYEALGAGEDSEQPPDTATDAETREAQNETEDPKSISTKPKSSQVPRKRKAIKVVGDDHDDQNVEPNESKVKKKPKKKAKAVKLSFDD